MFSCARKPGRIRTDNEVVFTSFVFTTRLKLVGIRYQRIQTCAPWQNGRIERLFGTLKPLLRQLVVPTTAALQSALQEFTLFYKHARAHLNLDGLTPAEKWNGWLKVTVRVGQVAPRLDAESYSRNGHMGIQKISSFCGLRLHAA